MEKNLLVYWDYRRKDLLLPFEKLKSTFHFYFIFFKDKNTDTADISFDRLYWTEFPTPYHLLDKLSPAALIFSDLSSLYAISLNIAAINRNIPTFLLEHGVKLSYQYYIDFEAKSKKLLKYKPYTHHHDIAGPSANNRKSATIKFFISAFKIKNGFNFFQGLKLLFALRKPPSDMVFANNRFALRTPSKYILFSRQNLDYYVKRDGISEEKVVYTGNPYQDDIIFKLEHPKSVSSYYLLLDDGQVEVFGISVEQKNNFFLKLNQFALSQNQKMVIKLHPFDYGRTDLIRNENIEYIQDCDLPSLIENAGGCFAISTTLMFPLIIAERVIIFKVNESKIQDEVAKFGVKFLDYLDFAVKEINFDLCKLSETQKNKIIEQFLYKYDNKAIERIKNCLLPSKS